MSDVDQIQASYREAVRLYLWYTGSKYSHHTNKASRDQAATYKRVFQQLHEDRRNELLSNV